MNRLRPKFFLVTGDITDSSPGEEPYESQASSIYFLAVLHTFLPLLLYFVCVRYHGSKGSYLLDYTPLACGNPIRNPPPKGKEQFRMHHVLVSLGISV